MEESKDCYVDIDIDVDIDVDADVLFRRRRKMENKKEYLENILFSWREEKQRRNKRKKIREDLSKNCQKASVSVLVKILVSSFSVGRWLLRAGCSIDRASTYFMIDDNDEDGENNVQWPAACYAGSTWQLKATQLDQWQCWWFCLLLWSGLIWC